MKIYLKPASFDIHLDEMLKQNTSLRYHIYYNKDMQSELSILCDKYGSDKGEIKSDGHPYSWLAHTYTDFYESMFGHCKEYIRNIFECGIGTNDTNIQSNMESAGRPGASLRVWRDYFPNAQIHGADIDRNILFSEDRISTYFVDQTSPESIGHLWGNVPVSEFDIMIDDGLHTFEAGKCMFENSFQKLRKGGVYIIEDVEEYQMLEFVKYFSDGRFNVNYVHLHRVKNDLGPNSLVVIMKR